MRLYTGWQCLLYCWYLSHIRDLLEGTLEHQTLHAGLAQCIQPDSILGNLKTCFLRTGKISLFWGVGKVLFSCLKSATDFPKLNCKVCMGTYLQKTKRGSSKSYIKSPITPIVIISTHALHFHHPGTRFKSRWRQWHERNSHTLTVHQWMTKQVINWVTSHRNCKLASTN